MSASIIPLQSHEHEAEPHGTHPLVRINVYTWRDSPEDPTRIAHFLLFQLSGSLNPNQNKDLQEAAILFFFLSGVIAYFLGPPRNPNLFY